MLFSSPLLLSAVLFAAVQWVTVVKKSTELTNCWHLLILELIWFKMASFVQPHCFFSGREFSYQYIAERVSLAVFLCASSKLVTVCRSLCDSSILCLYYLRWLHLLLEISGNKADHWTKCSCFWKVHESYITWIAWFFWLLFLQIESPEFHK